MIHSFEALGTKWWITLYEAPETAEVIFDDLRRFVTDFEARYSRFTPDSLISQLNRKRVLENPDEEFRTFLQFGKELYLRTNSIFNILTGHILEARGYDANYSFKDTGEELTPGNPITDLQISEEKISLTKGNVDIGGYGKGYLIDLLAERLKTEHNQNFFLINGGGDMYATSHHSEPIEIHLAHPTQPRTQISMTTLFDQGFASSSPHLRRWKTVHGETNHIVGNIKYDAMYIKANTTVDADAFATTLLLQTKYDQELFAQKENLGLARFSLNDSSFVANRLFIS